MKLKRGPEIAVKWVRVLEVLASVGISDGE